MTTLLSVIPMPLLREERTRWRRFIHYFLWHGPVVMVEGGDSFQPYYLCLFCDGWGWYDSQGNLCVQGRLNRDMGTLTRWGPRGM